MCGLARPQARATVHGTQPCAPSLSPSLFRLLPTLLSPLFFPFPSSPSLSSCRDPISPPPSLGFSPHPHFNHRRDPLPSPLPSLSPLPTIDAIATDALPSSFPEPIVPSLPLHLLRLCRAPPVTAPPLRLRRRQPRLSHRRLSPALSLSLLLDPPSASLHCVFHHRSPPRSPSLSTVGRLPLLPLHCTPISATTIVTTPASPLPSPGRRHLSAPSTAGFSPSSPPLPPFSATALFHALPFPPPPSPPSVLPLLSPRPSAIVDATAAASAPPSSSSHRLRPCLPAAVSLLPPPTVCVQAALPLLLPASA